MSPCCWGPRQLSALRGGGTWRRVTRAAGATAPAATSPGLTPCRQLPNPACNHPGCSWLHVQRRCHVPGALEQEDAPSPARCTRDTVATVKDLSGHGVAAESALQPPAEELLSPSWRVNNSTRKFLLWPRRWPLSALQRGKPQCQRARGAGPRCQPPAPLHPGSLAGICPGGAGCAGGGTHAALVPRSRVANHCFAALVPKEASKITLLWNQHPSLVQSGHSPKLSHCSCPEGKPRQAPSSSSELM